MKQAVIVSTARTGLTKSYRGVFNETHGATMGGHVIEQAVKRAGIDASWIEDAFVGCGYPEGVDRVKYRAPVGDPCRVAGQRFGGHCEPVLLVWSASCGYGCARHCDGGCPRRYWSRSGKYQPDATLAPVPVT